MNKKNMTKRIVFSAVIAAIYAVTTLALAPLSFSNIQFRVSEILVLLAFLDPFYIGGLTLGCLVANLLGPNGMMDVVFGTLATFISVTAISITAKYIKNTKIGLLVASIWPVLFNGLIIGWMLHVVADLPLILTMGEVAIGEFGVVTIIGVPVMTILMNKYEKRLKLNM